MNEAEVLIANDRSFESLRAFSTVLDRVFGAPRGDITEPRNDLTVAPVACRFYGMNGAHGGLVATHANQCGLITDRHAPCQMEMAGQTPDEKTCPLVKRIFGGE